MNTPKADGVEFARVLLWNICSMRAEIATLKAQMGDLLSALEKSPSAEAIRQSENAEAQNQILLYRDACTLVGLPQEPPGTPSGD